jgi:chemotaxis protein MotC
MRMRDTIFAGLFVAVATVSSGRAETKPPYEIVRSLQALHDQMALGNRAAHAEIPQILRRLGDKLVAVNPAVWREPRNARAVVIYILSGGEIRVAQKVLADKDCPASEKRLIEGALAYLEGDKTKAKTLLENVDPRSLDPAVGSHIALAQAALIADDDPKKAIKLLDMARVLAPGTLVEDAALRREVFLAEQTTDFNKFVDMAGQYLRRFRRSVYAASFQRGFPTAVEHLALAGNPQQLAELGGLFKGFGTHEKLRLFLHIAKSALVNGKIDVARWASENAAELAAKDSVAAHRATLYDGATLILTKDYAHGLAELEGVDVKHLPHDDLMLRNAAIGVATAIRQWPKVSVGQDKQIGAQADKPQTNSGDGASSFPASLMATMNSGEATIDRAQKMLAETDVVLGRRVQ